MMYKITIKDINTNEVFEYEISNLKEIRDILEEFRNKTIEVDINKNNKVLRKTK